VTIVLHQSTAKIAAVCLARYRSDLDGNEPVFWPYMVGTAAHVVAEQLTIASAAGNRLDEDVAYEALWTWWLEHREKAPAWVYHEACGVVESMLASRLRFSIPGRGNSCQVELEWALDANFKAVDVGSPEAHYGGTMDRLDWGDAGLVVTELKSTRAWPKQEDLPFLIQVRSYCLAALSLFPGVDRVTFKLVLLRHGRWQECTLERGDPWEDSVKRWLRSTRHHILEAEASGIWPETPSEACSLCGVWAKCETFRRMREQGATEEPRSDAEAAAGYLSLKRLFESYERQARDRAETRLLFAGHGFSLGFFPAKERHTLLFSVSVVLDELRAMGATTEDCARFFPGDRITTRALRTALEEMGERGLLGHESPADTYTTFITTTPSTRFTRRAFTTEEQEK